MYDYIKSLTVEVKIKFKRSDLVHRVPEELLMEVCNTVQDVVTKTIPKKKKCNKAKWLFEEVVTNSWEKKWKEKEKGKDIPIWMKTSKE